MATSTIVVLFTYNLSSKIDLNDQFKQVLEGLGWAYSIGTDKFPSTTCICVSNQKSEDKAVLVAVDQVKEVISQIREAGFSDFNVERYFFLAHKVPPSSAVIGANLL
jgi:hypothetical protein